MDMMTWYESYEKMVEKVAWLAARQYGLDQEDCRQEAWLALMKAESRYDASKGAKSTYLWTVCWRKLVDLARYQSRRVGQVLDEKNEPSYFELTEDWMREMSEDARVVMLAILEAPKELFRGQAKKVQRWLSKYLGWHHHRVNLALAEIRTGLE